ncbi:MAG: hypothetical protein KDA96_16500, partial [Planctomycetaceae bacterium]|nr:hypothetical protein [Planctomycetaceae bacterium]
PVMANDLEPGGAGGAPGNPAPGAIPDVAAFDQQRPEIAVPAPAGEVTPQLTNAEALAIAGVDRPLHDVNNLWITLSNLESRPNPSAPGLNQLNVTVNYEIISGAVVPNRTYFLYFVSDDENGQPFSQAVPLPIAQQRNGAVAATIQQRPGSRGKLRVAAGYPGPQNTPALVSGLLYVGQERSSIARIANPTTVAGPDAVGKTIAIANLRISEGANAVIRVDFQVQTGLRPGAQYFLVMQRVARNLSHTTECEITEDLQAAQIGAINVAKPDSLVMDGLAIFVEERIGEEIFVVSNRL